MRKNVILLNTTLSCVIFLMLSLALSSSQSYATTVNKIFTQNLQTSGLKTAEEKEIKDTVPPSPKELAQMKRNKSSLNSAQREALGLPALEKINDQKVRTYDVQVVTMDFKESDTAPLVKSKTNIAIAKAAVNRLDTRYSKVTNGKYRFNFVGFKYVTAPITDRYCSPNLSGITGVEPPNPTLGSDYTIQIFDVPWSCGGAIGIASMPGSKVLVAKNYMGNLDSIKAFDDILVHEIGHNIGLDHSNSIGCEGGSNSTSGNFDLTIGTCLANEYAGKHSWMSSVNLNSSYVPKLNGSQLYYLDVLDNDSVQFVDSTQKIHLTPLYSNTLGTKIAFVNGPKRVALEYRPAVDDESNLDNGDVFLGSGVILNVHNYDTEYYGLMRNHQLIAYKYTPGGPWFAHTPMAGLRVGATVKLWDNSVIRIDALDPIKGADITVARPADTTPPVAEGIIDSAFYAWNNPSTNYKISPDMNFDIDFLGAVDNRSCKTQLLVDGKVVSEAACERNTRKDVAFQNLFWKPTLGKHVLTLLAIDSAGNKTVADKETVTVEWPKPTIKFDFSNIVKLNNTIWLNVTGPTNKNVMIQAVGLSGVMHSTPLYLKEDMLDSKGNTSVWIKLKVPNSPKVRYVVVTPVGSATTQWYTVIGATPTPTYNVALTKTKTYPTYTTLTATGCASPVKCYVQKLVGKQWVSLITVTKPNFNITRNLTVRMVAITPNGNKVTPNIIT